MLRRVSHHYSHHPAGRVMTVVTLLRGVVVSIGIVWTTALAKKAKANCAKQTNYKKADRSKCQAVEIHNCTSLSTPFIASLCFKKN